MNLKRAFATFSIAATLCANVAQGQQISVYAAGLEGPRGLKFGPDGALYVAEAGHGGTTSTAGACAQVVPPVGPYHGGKTARTTGYIKDITGSTTPALYAIGGMTLLCALILMVGLPEKLRQKE